MADDFEHVPHGPVGQDAGERSEQDEDKRQRDQEYGAFRAWGRPVKPRGLFVQFEGRVPDRHAPAIVQEGGEKRPGYGKGRAAGNHAEQDDPAEVGTDQFRDGDGPGSRGQEGVTHGKACHERQTERHVRLQALMRHGENKRGKDDQRDIEEDRGRCQQANAGNLPLIGAETGRGGQFRGKRIERA